MKTRIILCAAVAALCASCTNDMEPVSQTPQTVTLNVSVGMPETKLAISASDTTDRKFNNVQIFVYNAANRLESSSGIQTSRSNISLSLVPGSKTVWAVVNSPAITAPNTLDGIGAIRSNLTDNTNSSMVMSGYAMINLVTSTNLSVTVKHIASKIVIDKISRKFTNQNYSEVPMKIKGIYMSNVAGDCDLACSGGAPTSWLCKRGVLASPPEGGSILADTGLNANLPENGSYNTSHVFYVYPNPTTTDSESSTWCARKTRLVIECEYNNKTCYYPVTIPGSGSSATTLERNKIYRITELTLKRPGSTEKDSKDPEVSSNSDFSFRIQVADWENGASYTEQF